VRIQPEIDSAFQNGASQLRFVTTNERKDSSLDDDDKFLFVSFFG